MEEGHFRTRPEDFFMMVALALVLMTACAIPLKVYFLAPSLTSMITYVWARKNPNVHVSLMFILNFQAKYLPWVLLGLYTFFEGSIPVTEVIGITVGHVYYYLEDIVPKLTGKRVLRAPVFLFVSPFLSSSLLLLSLTFSYFFFFIRYSLTGETPFSGMLTPLRCREKEICLEENPSDKKNENNPPKTCHSLRKTSNAAQSRSLPFPLSCLKKTRDMFGVVF